MVHRILLKLSLHPLYRYTFGHYLQSWGSNIYIYICLMFRIILQKWLVKAPEEDLHLPKPNIFIPRDLSLKNIEEKVTLWKTCLINIVFGILSSIPLAHPGKCSFHAEEDTVLQIVVQARYNVFHTQSLYQDGFSLSTVPKLTRVSSSYRCIHKVANGLFKWLWYVALPLIFFYASCNQGCSLFFFSFFLLFLYVLIWIELIMLTSYIKIIEMGLPD